MTEQITLPAEADYPELVTLWEASVRATHDFLSEEDIAFFRPLIQKAYLHTVNLYCIRDTHGISGFMGVANDVIEMLFVHPSHFGQGIGSTLLDHAITNLNVKAVDVNEQNPMALGFYQKHGFTITGRSAVDGMGKPFPLLHLSIVENEKLQPEV